MAAERERLLTQAERDKLERQLHQSQRLESLVVELGFPGCEALYHG